MVSNDGSELLALAKEFCDRTFGDMLAPAEVCMLTGRPAVGPCSETVSIPTRSFVSAANIPSRDAVANFQGAWKQVGQDSRSINIALRTFFILGRVWFGGDGSSGYLRLREEDGAVLFEDGVLEALPSQGLLCR